MGNTKRALEPSRAERKAKKRKLEDAIPDVPTDFDIQEHDSLTSKTARSTTKKGKINEGTSHPNLTMQIEGGQHEARKEAKKENKKKVITATDSHGADLPSVEKTTKNTISPTTRELVERATETSDIPKKSKKERKAERKAREAADVANRDKGNLVDSPHLRPEPNEHSTPSRSEHKKPAKNNRNREKKRKGINVENATAPGNGGISNAKAARFIVFIGSLPYTATTKSIQEHFAAVKPTSIRNITDKENPAKSKGYAFVEFEGYDHMKTCLKLFHHSTFDDGLSPPRKINVELTAGGGGNTKDRKSKIEAKNQKLNGERIRRLQEEERARSVKNEAAPDDNAIHPSRRARVWNA